MKKIVLVFILVLIVGLIFIQFKFSKEITSVITSSLPANIQLKYAKINTNILTGKIVLDSLSVRVLNSNKELHTSLYCTSLDISGLSLWAYFRNKKIDITDLSISNPKFKYFTNNRKDHVSIDSFSRTAFEKELEIDKISIINGSFNIITNEKDSLYVKMDSINFVLEKLKTDAKRLEEVLPFIYEDVQLSSKAIFMNINAYETLTIENFNFSNHQFNLQNLYLKPKFTKEVLSSKIAFERDRLQFHMLELKLNHLDFGIRNDTLFIIADSGEIVNPNLTVYRDKSVTDDVTTKKMYSKILRDLPFDLEIAELNIIEGYISYTERVDKFGKAGEIFFKNVNSTLSNLTNTNKNSKETKIIIKSYFMGKAPMELVISFDVEDNQDFFLASGSFKGFNTQIVNNFFELNLNARAEGDVEQIYFTFSGNDRSSKGDLKMKYEDFKFKILNDKNEVNKFLTAIGNIFVNDGSKTDEEGFRHGKIEANRNKTKSFFNYVWINIQSGLISAVTGDGEKD